VPVISIEFGHVVEGVMDESELEWEMAGQGNVRKRKTFRGENSRGKFPFEISLSAEKRRGTFFSRTLLLNWGQKKGRRVSQSIML